MANQYRGVRGDGWESVVEEGRKKQRKGGKGGKDIQKHILPLVFFPSNIPKRYSLVSFLFRAAVVCTEASKRTMTILVVRFMNF